MLPDRLTQLLFDGQLRWRMWRHGMTHREALLDLLHLEEAPEPPIPAKPATDGSTSVTPPRTEAAPSPATAQEAPGAYQAAPAPQPQAAVPAGDPQENTTAVREAAPSRATVDAAKAKRMREFGRMLLAVRAVLAECSTRYSRHCLDCRLMRGQSSAAIRAIDELFAALGYEPERIAKINRQPDLRRFLERTRQEAVGFEAKCERTDGDTRMLSMMAKSTAEERMQTSRALHRFHAWLRETYLGNRQALRKRRGESTEPIAFFRMVESKVILQTFEDIFAAFSVEMPRETDEPMPPLAVDGLDAGGLDAISFAFLRDIRSRVEARNAKRAAAEDEQEREALDAEIEGLEWAQRHYWRLFTQLTEQGRQPT